MRLFIAAVILTTSQACGIAGFRESSDPTTAATPDARASRGSALRISAGDLSSVPATSALDAVRRLRPEFLTPTDRRSGRPVSPSVYQNDRYIGGVDQLELIPLAPLVEIRWLSAVEAKNVYGSYCACDNGVIAVRTKP